MRFLHCLEGPTALPPAKEDCQFGIFLQEIYPVADARER